MAALALFGVFVLAALTSILPALQIRHAADPTHRCEFCQLGQIALLEPGGDLLGRSPAPAAGFALPEPAQPELQPAIRWRSPRAPPV